MEQLQELLLRSQLGMLRLRPGAWVAAAGISALLQLQPLGTESLCSPLTCWHSRPPAEAPHFVLQASIPCWRSSPCLPATSTRG